MHAHDFLIALTIVLGVAAVTTILFQLLRQPVVLGYILAGFIVGPHVPVPLVADPEVVRTLSELGVILLMFSLGLEFSLGRLLRLGPTATVTAVIQSSLMLWAGFVTGQAFGWTTLESLFAGSLIAISSTTIIAKAFEEQGVGGELRDLVVGVLVVEDLIAILLMATLTAIASGSGLSAGEMALTTARLAAFLVALVVVGLLVVPRAVRAVLRLRRAETTLVAAVGFCFAVSLLADAFGYSVALGAFLAGSLVAESGEQEAVERLVRPVRDIFAAVFFVSVGLSIDPGLIVRHSAAVAVLSLVVIVGKVAAVFVGALLTGNGVRTSVRAGMSLAQIGEFSFIIAALGLSLRATGDFLYPVAVAVSAVTTLTTPWLIRASDAVARQVDRRMPRRLQTFVSLYGSWLEQVRRRAPGAGRGAKLRRLVRLLALDVALVVAIVAVASTAMHGLSALVERRFGLEPALAGTAVVLAAVVAAVPLLAGVLRLARRVGAEIAEAALPSGGLGRLDLAAAPRRAFVVTIQLAVVLATGLPILALTQPFLGGVAGPLLFVTILAAAAVALWRGAADLHGHVRAGSQAIVEALLAQSRKGVAPARSRSTGEEEEGGLEALHRLLPGLGDPAAVRLRERSPAVGKSLGELDLRGETGAIVLAIRRGESGLLGPRGSEVLEAGDVLALAGTSAAVEAARQLLTGKRVPPGDAAGSPASQSPT